MWPEVDMNTFKKYSLATVSLVVAGMLPASVLASTAANTTITNTVTVNFEDAANVAQTPVQGSVDLTVNLVPSAPVLSSPADIDPTTENTANNLVYTITGTANGPDTYNFSSSDTPSNMDANATFTTPSATLGGSTLAADAGIGDGFIVVPYDGDDSDDEVNGFVAGDTIVINNVAYTVGAIDESATLSNNTVQIPLTTNITTADVIGSIVGERTTVTVVATTDDITTGASGTHTVSTTATSAADAGTSTTQTTPTVITVRQPVLTVTKYVRNFSNPVVGGGASVTIGADTWYTTGVNGRPTDIMEYLIVVDNTGAGGGVANDIVISDPIPQFTTFSAGTILLDADGTAVNLGAFVTQNETADDGDAAEFDATGNGTVYIYGGVGGDDTTAGAGNGDGGSLNNGQISRAVFRVTID